MVAAGTKTCRKCGVPLPISEFYRHPKMADRHLNVCRTCVKAQTIEYKRRRRRGETVPRVVGCHAPPRKYKKRPSREQRLAKRGILVKHVHIFVPAGRPEATYDRLVRLSKITCQAQQAIMLRAIDLYLDFLEKQISSPPPR